MDMVQTNRSPAPAGRPLVDELARLAPALDGFPVGQLLDVLSQAERQDRAQAYQLIDCCLSSWISSLEHNIDDCPHEPDDSLLRVQVRLCEARDALATLKSALSRLDVVHDFRGQPC
jgi:hypothetical protein